MSELRDFVAELLESKGAAVEAVDPDGLEVLAPAPLQKAMGWPELARLGFGSERSPRRDCDRARGRLARTVRRTARRRGTLERAGGEAGRRRSGAERLRNVCSTAHSICRTRFGVSRA